MHHLSSAMCLSLSCPFLSAKLLLFYCSFGVVSETKSGRLIKTPEKFASCVTGKRKIHKTKRMDSTLNSSFPDITSTSLMVNTAEQFEDEDDMTEMEATVSALDASATVSQVQENETYTDFMSGYVT